VNACYAATPNSWLMTRLWARRALLASLWNAHVERTNARSGPGQERVVMAAAGREDTTRRTDAA
jgi:hypothetical protein